MATGSTSESAELTLLAHVTGQLGWQEERPEPVGPTSLHPLHMPVQPYLLTCLHMSCRPTGLRSHTCSPCTQARCPACFQCASPMHTHSSRPTCSCSCMQVAMRAPHHATTCSLMMHTQAVHASPMHAPAIHPYVYMHCCACSLPPGMSVHEGPCVLMCPLPSLAALRTHYYQSPTH